MYENTTQVLNELLPLAEVARHLNMIFEPTDAHFCYLRRPDSVILSAHHHRDSRTNKHYFRFSISDLRDTTRNTGTQVTPRQAMTYDEERNDTWTTSIKIAADKTPEQIARELDRRLIGPCLPLWERMTERFNLYVNNKLSVDRLKPRIESVIKTVPGQNLYLKTFSIHEGKEQISLSLSCDLSQLEKIAAIFNSSI